MGLFSRWSKKADGKGMKTKGLEASSAGRFLMEAGLPLRPPGKPDGLLAVETLQKTQSQILPKTGAEEAATMCSDKVIEVDGPLTGNQQALMTGGSPRLECEAVEHGFDEEAAEGGSESGLEGDSEGGEEGRDLYEPRYSDDDEDRSIFKNHLVPAGAAEMNREGQLEAEETGSLHVYSEGSRAASDAEREEGNPGYKSAPCGEVTQKSSDEGLAPGDQDSGRADFRQGSSDLSPKGWGVSHHAVLPPKSEQEVTEQVLTGLSGPSGSEAGQARALIGKIRDKKPWWRLFVSTNKGRSETGAEKPLSMVGGYAQRQSPRSISPFSDSAALKLHEQPLAANDSPKLSKFYDQPPSGSANRGEGQLARTTSGLSAPSPEVSPPVPSIGLATALRRARKEATAMSPLSRVQAWVAEVDPSQFDYEDWNNAGKGIENEDPSSPPSWLGSELVSEKGPVVLTKQVVTAPVPRVGADPDVLQANALVAKVDINSTAIYLSNEGLKAVPSLSPFASLRVLDLSRNLLARVHSGLLPRTLHWLDLSHNKLTAVEGLRELTRLRVLKLNNNRIARIGHGLGNCQSLRELYLGHNKISEVEGLHRLLKLQVLDLSHNKVTSSKALSQLAANHSSMQALDLSDNPLLATSSMDQLRKLVLSLLTNLLYLNKHPVKSSALPRDAAMERAALGGAHASRASKKGGRISGGTPSSASVRKVRASTGSITSGAASSHRSLGRSKSHSRLGSLASVNEHHHQHHHKRSHGLPLPSTHKQGHSSSHHHHRHAQAGVPPRAPSPGTSRMQLVVDQERLEGNFEFNALPTVRSDGALATPRVWAEGADLQATEGQISMQSEGEYSYTPPMSPQHTMSAPVSPIGVSL